MDREPPLEVIKHAQGIARHVVRLGFADLATTRQHFLDYFFYLKLGFDGSFTQILLARKVVDQHGFQMLERIAPFSQYVGREGAGQARMQSNVVRLPPGREAGAPQSSSSTLLYEGVLPTPPAAGQQAAQTVFYEGVLPTPAGATPESTLPLPDFDPPTERPERPVTAKLAPGEPFGGREVATQYVDTGGPDAAASEVDLFFPELADRNRMPSGAHPLPSSGSHNLPSGAHGLPGGPPLSIYESPTHLESPTQHPGHEHPTFLDAPPSEASTHVDGPGPSAAVSAFDPIASWGLEENEIEVNLSRSQVAAKMGLPQAMPELAPPATPPGDLLPDTREEERGTLKSLKGLDPSDTGDLFWRSESGSGSGERPPETFLQPKLGGFLGEFELLEVLGQGGMGVVYKSRRQSTDKLYALKVLRVRQGAKLESRRKRFRREVKAMQRLRHPNIVNVHGYGRDGPFDWYVMEYVDGKDLASLMAARALDDEQKLELFLQVCGALIHSHERGVVHRDLKPQNILVDADLQVHILDFGLAKILDTDSGLTHTGSALGTPYYMSPEQVADPTKVGPRSDIFSLGVILYELITNQRPFPGVTAGEVGNKILSREPPPPSTVNNAVHPNLDVIAAKAMEKNPDRRYATIQALHDDLVRHMSGKGVKGQSPVVAGVRRYVEKNRSGLVIGVLVASVLFAVVGILGGMVYLFVAG